MAGNTARRMPKEIAGIRIPDTRLAVETMELVREVSPPALFNHVVRTYIFGAQVGRNLDLHYDAEVVFVAALMHDLGLTPPYIGPGRFEVDGADAAAKFLSDHAVAADKVALVWDAIALHSSNGIAERKQPEVALVHFGAAVDVDGSMLDHIPVEVVQQTLATYPRLGFKKAFLEAIAEVLRQKPATGFLNFMEGIGKRYVPGFQPPDVCEIIMAAPYSE